MFLFYILAVIVRMVYVNIANAMLSHIVGCGASYRLAFQLAILIVLRSFDYFPFTLLIISDLIMLDIFFL